MLVVAKSFGGFTESDEKILQGNRPVCLAGETFIEFAFCMY